MAPKKTNISDIVLTNFLIFFFLLSLVFVGGEVFFRFFYDRTDAFSVTKVSQRWFQRYYQRNQAGFRDNREYAWDVPKGKTRVTFLGDSFTAGHGIKDVDKRFVNRIRKMNPNWDVQIIADVGWDTSKVINVLAKGLIRGYDANYFVYVYVLNDIVELIEEHADYSKRVYEDPHTNNLLIKHSYFINFLYYRLKALRDPEAFRYYDYVKKAYSTPAFREQKLRFEDMKRVVEKHGGRLLVVTFPFLHELGAHYEYREVHQKLRKAWDDLEVPHLDLLAVFEDIPPSELVLYRSDPHPNAKAHFLAAQAIQTFLSEELPKLPLLTANRRRR